MGYSFHGIFTNSSDENISAKAKLKWPFSRIKNIYVPFTGMAIVGDNEYPDFEKTHDENRRLQYELPEFSNAFPETNFVFLWVDCHGGTCIYEGYACRNGQIFFDNRGEDSEPFSQSFERNKLRELLRSLDIELGALAEFEPLTRGYFD